MKFCNPPVSTSQDVELYVFTLISLSLNKYLKFKFKNNFIYIFPFYSNEIA